jgi:hypothetical protein
LTNTAQHEELSQVRKLLFFGENIKMSHYNPPDKDQSVIAVLIISRMVVEQHSSFEELSIGPRAPVNGGGARQRAPENINEQRISVIL